jgi:hypothetical protein
MKGIVPAILLSYNVRKQIRAFHNQGKRSHQPRFQNVEVSRVSLRGGRVAMTKQLFFYVAFCAAFSSLSARIIHIPQDFPLIQQAIDNASSGDTLLVQPGIYKEHIDFKGKNIVLASLFIVNQDTSYVSKTILDGDRSGTVVDFHSGEDSTASLTGFTIRNGNWDTRGSWDNGDGAGIRCIQHSSPVLRHLRLTANSGLGVGAIYCENASLKLEDAVIAFNTAMAPTSSNAGAVWAQYASLDFHNVIIDNNKGDYAGGFYCVNSKVHLMDVRIINNRGNESWGGNFFRNSTVEIKNSIIANNSGWRAGGITCDSSNVELSNTVFSGNSGAIYLKNHSTANIRELTVDSNVSASDGDRGIICAENATLTIFRSAIFNNTYGYGGSITCFDGKATVINCTIVGNKSRFSGNQAAGIFLANNSNGGYSSVVLVNSILWGNSPFQAAAWLANGSMTISHSCIQGGENGLSFKNKSQYNWLDGNLTADPAFVNSSNYDFQLTGHSPCIDGGIKRFYFQGVALLNLEDGDFSGSAPDMGAFESGDDSVSNDHNPDPDPAMPSASQVYPNYPNPFNSGTRINYDLSKTDDVQIRIYNLKGQLIFRGKQYHVEKGTHSFIWNGMDENRRPVPSGIYPVVLSTSDSMYFIKMTKLD